MKNAVKMRFASFVIAAALVACMNEDKSKDLPMLDPSSGAPDLSHPGQPIVNGALSREIVQRAVSQRSIQVRLCYQKGLQRVPTLSGVVMVDFTIDEQGAVKDAKAGAATSLSDPETVDCVVHLFSRISFPKPDGGVVTVSYPVALAQK